MCFYFRHKRWVALVLTRRRSGPLWIVQETSSNCSQMLILPEPWRNVRPVCGHWQTFQGPIQGFFLGCRPNGRLSQNTEILLHWSSSSGLDWENTKPHKWQNEQKQWVNLGISWAITVLLFIFMLFFLSLFVFNGWLTKLQTIKFVFVCLGGNKKENGQ